MDQENVLDFVWLAFDGRIGHVVLILLALMSAGAVRITIGRILRYKAARKDSRNFKQHVVAFRDHNLDDLISIAQNNNSPSAVVIASGLVAFQKARFLSSDVFAFEAAKRASRLSARGVHCEMNRGLNHLAAIAATVLFVGVFGTCYGMLTAFKGCAFETRQWRCQMALPHSPQVRHAGNRQQPALPFRRSVAFVNCAGGWNRQNCCRFGH